MHGGADTCASKSGKKETNQIYLPRVHAEGVSPRKEWLPSTCGEHTRMTTQDLDWPFMTGDEPCDWRSVHPMCRVAVWGMCSKITIWTASVLVAHVLGVECVHTGDYPNLTMCSADPCMHVVLVIFNQMKHIQENKWVWISIHWRADIAEWSHTSWA